MDLGLGVSGSLQDKLVLTLERRDMALLNMCLMVVAHNHTKSSGLRSDIESLQSRLTQQEKAPGSFKKQPCDDNCRCQKKK